MTLTALDLTNWAPAALAGLWRASWQGALVIALVWLISRPVLGLPAWARSWLWRLVMLKLLLLVVWPWPLEVPVLAYEPGDLNPFADQGPVPVLVEIPGHSTLGGQTTSPPPAEQPPVGWAASVSVPVALGALWVAGVAGIVILLTSRAHGARRWRRDCTLVKDPVILSLCESLAGQLGLYQPPVLLASRRCDSPVVFGALRTSVVLPARLVEHPDTVRLRMILGHELAHVVRGDLLWNWLATLAWAVFFFHPLVWIALRELRLSQELACDAKAIELQSASPADYGRLLVELADHARVAPNMLVTIGVVESFEFLKRRLRAMTHLHANPRWAKPVSLAFLCIAVAGLLPWKLVAQTAEPAEEAAPPVQGPAARSVAPGRARAASRPAGRMVPAVAAARPAGRMVPAMAASMPAVQPPLASTTSGQYTINAIGVRWVDSAQVALVRNGFPVQANAMVPGNSRVAGAASPGGGGGRNGGGGGGGGDGAASARGGRLEAPNLVVDLQVAGQDQKQKELACVLVGKVAAKDERGRDISSPELPAHLQMELRGMTYPRGSGCAAVHLKVPEKDAKAIESLAGTLLVADARVRRASFTLGEEGKSVRAGGATFELQALDSGPEGFAAELTVTTPVRTESAGSSPRRPGGLPRLEVLLEDSEGKLHASTGGSGGGGGGSGGASGGSAVGGFSTGGGAVPAVAAGGRRRGLDFAPPTPGGGGPAGGGGAGGGSAVGGSAGGRSGGGAGFGGAPGAPARAGNAPAVMETKGRYEFAALPAGVTAKRLVCSTTELISEPRPVEFELKNLRLP